VTDQLALVPEEPAKLTERQQAAYDYLAAHDGVPVDELGANWHAIRGKHAAGARCDWCGQEGRDVVRSKALRPLVTYRRTPDGSLYFLRGRQPEPAPAPVSGYDPATAPIPY